MRFKELADKKVEITEADLEAIVAEELGTGMVHRFAIHELELHGGTAHDADARASCSTDGDGKVEANGTGDGMIDAAIAAISEATGVTGTVGNFQVSSVTGGSDALGDGRDHGRRRRPQGHAVAASRPTSSRPRPARTSRRSTRSCACGSARSRSRERVVGP